MKPSRLVESAPRSRRRSRRKGEHGFDAEQGVAAEYLYDLTQDYKNADDGPAEIISGFEAEASTPAGWIGNLTLAARPW